MKKQELAKVIREMHCLDCNIPDDSLNHLSDDVVIESLTTCPCCGESLVDDVVLIKIINDSSSIEEFDRKLDIAIDMNLNPHTQN